MIHRDGMGEVQFLRTRRLRRRWVFCAECWRLFLPQVQKRFPWFCPRCAHDW